MCIYVYMHIWIFFIYIYMYIYIYIYIFDSIRNDIRSANPSTYESEPISTPDLFNTKPYRHWQFKASREAPEN